MNLVAAARPTDWDKMLPALWRSLGETLYMVGISLLVALVGGSRLYLGYHFTTDVLAGASLALAVLGVVVLADVGLPALRARRSAGRHDPGRIVGPP